MPAVPVLPVDPAEAALAAVRELGAAAAPAADFVSAALLGDIEEDEDFLAGYASATGTPVVFTASLRLRLALYRSYLYLIMLVETVPRQASQDAVEWVWTRVAPRLDAALDEVGRAVSPRNAG